MRCLNWFVSIHGPHIGFCNGYRSCKTHSSCSDLVSRLLSLNRCDHLWVTLTRTCKTVLLITLTLDLYRERVGSGSSLSVFWQERERGVCVSNAQVATMLGFNVWLKTQSGGINPCSTAACFAKNCIFPMNLVVSARTEEAKESWDSFLPSGWAACHVLKDSCIGLNVSVLMIWHSVMAGATAYEGLLGRSGKAQLADCPCFLSGGIPETAGHRKVCLT